MSINYSAYFSQIFNQKLISIIANYPYFCIFYNSNGYKLQINKRVLLAASTGLLLSMAFPPMPFFLFAFIAFIPLLFALIELKPKHSLWLVYLTFFIYHFGTNWWISSWQKDTDPFLMASGLGLSIVHPLFFMIPISAFLRILRRSGRNIAIWSFPFLWLSFEWLHSLGEMSYPWLAIGNTQIHNYYWIQFIDITGVWGSSFLIALVNVIILQSIFYLRENQIVWKDFLKVQKLKYYMISLLLIFIIPMIYGGIRINQFNHLNLLKNNKSINIAVIQPNINPWRKWKGSVMDQVDEHIQIMDSLKKAKNFDLAIWSETAIPYHDFAVNSFHNLHFLSSWVTQNKTSLLTGFADIVLYDKGKAPKTAKKMGGDNSFLYESFNSAIIINPEKPYVKEIYHKMKLTPFAERFPYAEVVGFLKQFMEWGVGISSWNIGVQQKSLTVKYGKDSTKIGSIICIESIYPEFVSNFSKMGAEVLCVITNDAWYDYTFGPEQHYQIAALRAIESRRYIARCANTGISGFISPTGISISRLEQYKATANSELLPLIKETTIYAKLGDILPYITIFVSVILVFYKKK